jgi:hypothetical protein
MRISYPILLFSTTLLLTACDRHPETAQVAQPAPCACNVPPAIPPAVPAADVPIHHARHHWRSTERVEEESSAYDYEGEGHTYGPNDEIHDSGEPSFQGQEEARADPVWTDAYGRQHYAFRRDRKEPPANERARLDPWHGYEEN